MPVLAITGMQETSVLGTGYQQEVHLDRLFDDVAEYNLLVDNPAQLPGVVDIAIRTALARRGVAHLTIPNDVQVADADDDPYQHVAPARPPATAPIYLPPPGRPGRRTCEAAAAGAQRRARRSRSWPASARCTPATRCWRWPTQLGAPVIKTLPGKAVIPDDSPFAVGGIGLLGTRPGEDLVEDCDTLLMIGTNFPYTQHLPAAGQGPGGADRGRPDPGRRPDADRGPADRRRQGDPAGAAAAADPQADRGHLEKYQKAMAKWRDGHGGAGESPSASPIAPQYPWA